MSLNFKENQELFGLNVDETSKAHLLETVRWGKFVGIMFAIFIVLCTLMVCVTMLDNPVLPPLSGLLFAVICVGVNFYPLFALLKFSALAKNGVVTENQQQFNSALRYLKNLFKYIGIATIVMVLFYAVAIGVAITGKRL